MVVDLKIGHSVQASFCSDKPAPPSTSILSDSSENPRAEKEERMRGGVPSELGSM